MKVLQQREFDDTFANEGLSLHSGLLSKQICNRVYP
jgi:hypothetical protein